MYSEEVSDVPVKRLGMHFTGTNDAQVFEDAYRLLVVFKHVMDVLEDELVAGVINFIPRSFGQVDHELLLAIHHR